MKRQILIGLVALLAVTNTLLSAEQPAYKPGVILVRFANVGTQPPNTAGKNTILNSVFPSGGTMVKQEFTLVSGLTRVAIPANMSVESAVASLKQSSSVLYAEPVYIYKLYAVPNDTRFGELWGMRNIGQGNGTPGADISATSAWDISTGNNIIVAVTDTGVDYNHPDLNANMWRNPGEIPGNGIDDDGDGFIDDVYGVDTGDMDGDPMDDSPIAGHGTHVSGTIGAVGNNNIGVTGVCWHVKIMAVKIADSNGFLTGPIAGIDYAVAHGAKVINASWGGGPYSQALYDSIKAARDAGVLFVAAAGNDSANNDLIPSYPDGYNLANIIAVMATNNNDTPSYYSNYGLTTVDIGAPGGDTRFGDAGGILSTLPGNQYGFYQGTSMASPHVAGACALLLSIKPTMGYADVKQLLMSTVDPVLPGLCVSGGRMNLAAAAQEAATDTTPPSPPIAAWDIEPKATGFHTVSMEAKISTDISGVEYYFECVNDVTINSGWEPNTLYTFSTLSPSTTYGFHVKARDKSVQHNETAWSDTIYTTTSPDGVDNLTPAPDPAQWGAKPRMMRLNPPSIRMRAFGVDESGVQYQFRWWDINTPGNVHYINWQDSDTTTVTTGLQVDHVYKFQCETRDKSAPSNVTPYSDVAIVALSAGPRILYVPAQYDTIQAAINDSADGDVVEVSPDTYMGTGNRNIDFGGRDITVRSIDPENPAIVAATIIDCQGTRDPNNPRRAFIFTTGEGPDSILSGFTIRNGYYKGGGGDVLSANGRSGVGGAIACFGASPTIRNCVIENSIAEGGDGRDGARGINFTPGTPGTPGDANNPTIQPVPPTRGENGGNGGAALGGGIYCDSGSGALIENTVIRNCQALSGNAGNGGNGGDGSTLIDPVTRSPMPGAIGGRGGITNRAAGGGIFCDAGSVGQIVGCTVNGCFAGSFGTPGARGLPGVNRDPDPTIPLFGTDASAYGGGIFYGVQNSAINISSTTVSQNRTDQLNGRNSPGGGICVDSNASAIATLTGCVITGNNPNGDGGGIAQIVSDFAKTNLHRLVLRNCDITGNDANNSGGGLGIRQDGSKSIEIYDSNFADNDSRVDGGGIFLNNYSSYNTTLTLQNCELKGNTAQSGGAIEVFDSIVSITGSRIAGNTATSPSGLGGGLALWNTDGNVIDSNISDNTANSFGGGAFVTGWTTSPVHFKNCLISENSAVFEGGGLACNVAGWALLDNCTVINNTVTNGGSGSGGGIISTEQYAWVEINNSILWDNSAAYGPQIAIGSPLGPYCDGTERAIADVDVSYSDVDGGQSSVFIMDPTFDCTALWWLAGNIDVDPLFALDYYLSSIAAGQDIDSPCINMGSADANSSDIGLAGYTTRTDGVADTGIVDLGYHRLAGLPTRFPLTLEVFDAGFGAYGRLNAKPRPLTDAQFDINDPNTILVNQGTIVNLTAIPELNFRVQSWSGTDNDNSTALTNTVTMDSGKKVVVTFEPVGAYFLTVSVAGGAGTVDPNGRSLRAAGEVVTLTATPSNPSDVIVWSGTDDDYSHLTTNKVTMDGHKNVTVRFYSPKILYVGADGDFLTIQQGINEANDGDIVMVLPGTYSIYESSEDNTQLFVISKAITITSVNPTHPEDTIILGGFAILNVGRDTVIDGFTIQGNYVTANGCPGMNTNCGNALPDGSNGYSIAGGGMVLHSYYWPTNRGDPILPPFSASPTVRNCVFQNCSIQAGHGALGSDGGDGGWGGFAHGGAVSVGPDSNPLFENCLFVGNRAYPGDGGNGGNNGHGGQWSWSGINWDWAPIGGYMDYWRYSGYGGAVYCDTNSTPDFNNCAFVNNIAYGGSCGIGATIISGWPNSHYQIDRYGGAVYCAAESKPLFTNCIFNANQADTNGLRWHWNRTDTADSAIEYANLSYGGAIAFEDNAAPQFINCNISGNIAHIGGGAWSDDAYPNFADSRFVSNVANDGAGMLVVDGQANIERTEFITNTANISGSEGGAIGLYGTNADIIDCNLTGNTSLGYGGGIYISSKYIDGQTLDGNSTVFVKNCLIINNRATQGGAGISAAWHSDPNIVNCTITGNVSSAGPGGGLYASYSNYTTIVNSIIWGNTAFTGNEIAVGVPIAPSRVDVSYSDIKQTMGSLDVQAGGILNLNAGVIDANPLFALGSYYLSQTAAGQLFDSPCVDKGGNDVNDPRIELGGYTTRTDNMPDEGIVDMGYHYQPVIYSEEMFTLTISKIGPGEISIYPDSETGEYAGGTKVIITADPCSGYRVRKWTGTDNDSSASLTNVVTMSGNKNVSVEFGVPAMLTVPGDYTTIQGAVTVAKAGDIISIASGVYDTPNLIIDKDITLTSSNPDDPCVVAATVIDGVGQACYGVIFTGNTSDQAILNGITIANAGYGFVPIVDSTVAGQNGGDGGNGDGAGIYIMSGASPTIKNCIVRNCNINGGNAGKGGNASETTNAGRGGWGGWAHGAGIFVSSLANPTIVNTTITGNNVTGGNGGNGGDFSDNGGDAGVGGNWSDGAIWETWGYIGDYRFYSGYGAGVYCDRNSAATFIACNITNNTARGGVSGIGGNRNTGVQIPPPDTSYEIPAYGGGAYCAAGSRVTFEDCNITGNTAVKPGVTYHVDPYLGHGGGVAFENTASIKFENCNISDNNSSVGGGIFWSGGAPVVIDANISNNSAYIGGGIYGTHSSGLINNCNFRNNFAGVEPNDVDVIIGEGGGLYASSMGALIEDSVFTQNITDASGGGIYVYGVSDAATTIKNCLIVNNEAGRDGGAISANWEAVVDVQNCTIYSNRATGSFGLRGTTGFGGGLYCSYGADTNIINSILWDNNSFNESFGTQIAVESGFEFVQLCGTVSVSYSDINGGADGGVRTGNCTSGLIWGPGNTEANALFIDTANLNFRLEQQTAGQHRTSPCVDAGSDFSSKFGLHRYTTRTDRAPDILTVDMGYHYFRPEESCIKVYYSSDGIVNFDDLSYIARSWLNRGCTESDGWCQGRDVTYDGSVDNYDMMDFANCWLQGFGATCGGDVTPPSPNPMRWEIPPMPVSNSSITMVAEIATDDSRGPVEYQFERATEVNNVTYTGWQLVRTFTDTGLQPNTQYCYRVRATDECGNMTNWSEPVCVENLADTNAPAPPPTIVFLAGVPNTTPDVCTFSAQFQFPYQFPDFDMTWWHKVVVDVTGVVDDSGGPVEIRFVCSDNNLSSSSRIPLAFRPILIGAAQNTLGSKADGWRLTYNGNTIIYDVRTEQVGGTGVPKSWTVCAYDAAMNSACSLPHTIGP